MPSGRRSRAVILPYIGKRMATATHCARAIDEDIRAGRIVIANVSRTVIDAMRRAYADVMKRH